MQSIQNKITAITVLTVCDIKRNNTIRKRIRCKCTDPNVFFRDAAVSDYLDSQQVVGPRMAQFALARPLRHSHNKNKIHSTVRQAWGPLPGGQGGRPPPPQILEENFSIHSAPPPDFGGFCSEMF